MKLRLLRMAFVSLTTVQVLLAIAASPLNILIGWVEALADHVDEKAWEIGGVKINNKNESK